MTHRARLVVTGLYALLLIVFVKNAWMADDAYITFRSVEQLIAGNGPRWNAFERVQAYTSVFWFFLLAAFRLFISDIYYVALLVSLLCCVATVWVMRKLVDTSISFALLLLLLIASPSVIDFTTSGLENPLGYLLLAVFSWLALGADQSVMRHRLLALLIVAGLAPLVRHDLVVLVWPATALLFWHWKTALRWQSVLLWLAIAMLPLAGWTLASLVYYGVPFPNTAYAKLNTDVAASDLIRSGLIYVWVSCRDDPVAGLLLVVGVIAGWLRGGVYRAFAVGILLHLAYVVKIGGDFMRGRFLAFDVLLAALMLAHLWRGAGLRVAAVVAGIALLALSLNPFSPLFPADYLKTRLGYYFYSQTAIYANNGVIDEKYAYYSYTGLMKILMGEAASFSEEVCQRGPGCVRTEDLRQCPIETPYAKCTQVAGMIGVFGYRAGHMARIIDRLALTDPLLARLHPVPGVVHRAGHAERKIPKGYVESVESGRNLIDDKRVAELYDQIKLITQSDNLFTVQRLRVIWRLNTGQLKHLAVTDYP